jgi:predicted regulator of Ras-like GTPase activity (Roadblock/LC7/MglB family)
VDTLAAFAAALFQRTCRTNVAAGYGDTQQLVLDASGGRLFVAAHGDLALVVLADREAGAGLIRVALQRAVRAVA